MTAAIESKTRQRIADMGRSAIETAANEAIEIAIAMLDKALREGQPEPEAKVSASVVLRYFGGEWQCEADAKAERKEAEKVQQVSARFNPNQPELFGEDNQ